jgi:hypothetical protein
MRKDSWNLSIQNNKIYEFRGLINSTQWDPPSLDRQYIFGALCAQLMSINEVDWNMFDLNAKNGLHNLKKEIRWHRLEISLFAGDVLSVDDNGCANNEILTEFNQFVSEQHIVDKICLKDRYLENLKNLSSNNVCKLSACYLKRLDDAYALLSSIKDEAEGLEAIGEHISRKRLREVDDMYRSLKSDKIFRMISSEMKSCLNKTR